MQGNFFEKLKRVKIGEIIQVWKLPIALLCFPFYKLFHRNLWIVCEDENEARDNGYWFFRFVKENHPEQECIYAIKKSSPDFDKVSMIGKTVEFGSLKHWIQYMASTIKISSQKAGNPNAAIFYFLEVYGLLKNKRVFLQHGVVKDDLKWLYYEVTKMRIFICGAYPEYKYVDSTFHYPEGYVRYTGLCRYDGLHDFEVDKQTILIMPTWREWIADEDERLELYEGTNVIPETKFFTSWSDFINDDRITQIANKYGVRFIFYPHREMQKYIDYFPNDKDNVIIARTEEYDVQELLKNSSMLITDYSSVFFDMFYMKKPVIFYQFDYDVYRKAQYGEGYFNYKNNPFGKSCSTKDEVFSLIEECINNNFSVSRDYSLAHKEYFKLYDTNNCKRIYEVICSL